MSGALEVKWKKVRSSLRGGPPVKASSKACPGITTMFFKTTSNLSGTALDSMSTDVDSLSAVLWEAVHVQHSRVDGATRIILPKTALSGLVWEVMGRPPVLHLG